MPTQAEKAQAFEALHRGEPFVIPNPWDAGSARMLAALGFQALATTSGGFAFTLGRLDGNVTLEEVAAHVRALVEATDLPVSVDLENGYGSEPEAAARAIEAVAEAGAVGGSIEDWDPVEARLYDPGHAAERIVAAVEAGRRQAFPFTLTARAENHLHGVDDLDDTIARLQVFEAAGADVLYAPWLQTTDVIGMVCAAVSRPVNVLAVPGLSFAELAAAGAQRISVGSRLTWAAVEAAADAARKMLDGDLSGLRNSPPLDDWFG
jgi:2-methylisocitrate lyase-like PEP mutase family enzyme